MHVSHSTHLCPCRSLGQIPHPHPSLLRLCHINMGRTIMCPNPGSSPAPARSPTLHVPAKILDHTEDDLGMRRYKVQWQAHPTHAASWVDERSFVGGNEAPMVRAYMRATRVGALEIRKQKRRAAISAAVAARRKLKSATESPAPRADSKKAPMVRAYTRATRAHTRATRSPPGALMQKRRAAVSAAVAARRKVKPATESPAPRADSEDDVPLAKLHEDHIPLAELLAQRVPARA